MAVRAGTGRVRAPLELNAVAVRRFEADGVTSHGPAGLGGYAVRPPSRFVIRLTIDDAAAVRAISFQRWGDPDTSGTWGWHSFGGEITGQRTFAGLTIPSHGRLGWHTSPGGRASGEFFRFEITSLALSPTAAGRP